MLQVSESAWASRINFLEDLDEDEAMEEDEQEEDPMPPTNGNVQVGTQPLWLSCLACAGAASQLVHCQPGWGSVLVDVTHWCRCLP